MPEQIQATTFDQVLTGETHDFAYLFSMSWFEAMDLTMFAGRFLFQRAPQPAVKCIQQECAAFVADRELAKRQPLDLGVVSDYDRFVACVFDLAVNRSELQQHLKVLDFLAGEWLRLR